MQQATIMLLLYRGEGLLARSQICRTTHTSPCSTMITKPAECLLMLAGLSMAMTPGATRKLLQTTTRSTGRGGLLEVAIVRRQTDLKDIRSNFATACRLCWQSDLPNIGHRRCNFLMSGRYDCDEHAHYSDRAPWLRAAVLGANDGLVSVASIMFGVGEQSSSSHPCSSC